MAKRGWLKVEGYDDILDSIALFRPDSPPEYISIRISEEQPASESEVFPPVDLWLPTEQLAKLDGLRKLLQKGLAELGHSTSDAVVDSLLPLIPMIPAAGRKKLARLFSSFRVTPVTQTLVLPFSRVDSKEAAQPIKIEDFGLKPFRSSLKLSFALAAKHPLGIRLLPLEQCDGNWCIERTLESVPYCDVSSYEDVLGNFLASVTPEGAPWQESAPATLVGGLFFQNYGFQCQQSLQDRFFTDFRKAQAPHVALGGSFFPIQDVRGLDGCLFLDEWHDASFNSSRGILIAGKVVQGLGPKLGYEFGNFLRTLDFHRDLTIAVATAAGTDQFLGTFADILVMAREQAQGARPDVAFLLCCTALEYLLVGGPTEPIARTLGRRLGALQSLSRNVSFHDAARDIQQLYDTRSQFAHRAVPIEFEKLDRLFSLCVLAYTAAAQASVHWQIRFIGADGLRTVEPESWIGRWRKVLDYLGSALGAGIMVDGKAAAEAGIDS